MDFYQPPYMPRPWYRPRWRTVIFWSMAALAFSSVYSFWTDYADQAARRARELLAPAVGARCSVEIDDDLQHAPPRRIEGRFRMLNDHWIVLDGLQAGEGQHWIPAGRVTVLDVAE